MTERSDEAGFAKLAGGGEIAYQTHGLARDRPPLLLVRPLGGSMALWGSFGSLLAETFHVIAFDHRGSGRSRKGAARSTTRALARDALAVLDHLRVSRAHVFGISLGGMAATWLAILAPARVARLAIAAAPARGIDTTRNGIGRELALAACVADPRRGLDARLVHRVLSPAFRDAHPDEVRRIERVVAEHPGSRTSLAMHVVAGALHDARSELGRIRAPTLVLAGENDDLLGVAPCRELALAIMGATFETIASSGHDLTLEQPIATATRLTDFFLAGVGRNAN